MPLVEDNVAARAPLSHGAYTSRVRVEDPAPEISLTPSPRGAFRAISEVAFGLILADILILSLIYFDLAWLKKPISLDMATYFLLLTTHLIATTVVGGYTRKTDFTTLRYGCEHMIGAAGAFFVTVLTVYYLFPDHFVASRAIVLATMVAAPVTQLIVRRATHNLARKQNRENTLIVITDDAQNLDSHLKQEVETTRAYFLSPTTGLITASNQAVNILSGYALHQAIAKLGVQLKAVVIGTNAGRLPDRLQNQLIAANFKYAPVYTLESYYAQEYKSVPLSTLTAPWAFEEGFRLAQSATYARFKRILDVVLSGIALVLLSPLLGLLAVLVKLDSPGPAFFRQARVGQYEEPFTMIKFRSMRVGSEKGPRYTGEKDNRITRLGNFLRKSRLDELPQLINVLKGDMSLIGPRAEWDKLVADYENQIPYYHLRHLVRPGITGWAQVNYPYGANLEDTKQKLMYDLYYVRYYSFMLDFRIIAKTLFVMFFGKGR